MAENNQEIGKAANQKIDEAVKKIPESFKYENLQEAYKLALKIVEMKREVERIELALDSKNFKNPKDAEKAREVFSQKLELALQFLKKYIKINPEATIQVTRDELTRLGLLAEKGPQSYLEQSLWEKLVSRIDQLFEYIKNGKPEEVVKEIKNAAESAQTETLAQAGKESALDLTGRGMGYHYWRERALREYGKGEGKGE